MAKRPLSSLLLSLSPHPKRPHLSDFLYLFALLSIFSLLLHHLTPAAAKPDFEGFDADEDDDFSIGEPKSDDFLKRQKSRNFIPCASAVVSGEAEPEVGRLPRGGELGGAPRPPRRNPPPRNHSLWPLRLLLRLLRHLPLLQNQAPPQAGYRVTKNLTATSGIQLPGWVEKGPNWMAVQSSWIGYVAVCQDRREISRLGRRDVVIALRGTATGLGFLSLYISAAGNKPSLQSLVREEISRSRRNLGILD